MAKTLQQLLTKISLRKLEEASVVFKETQEGSEYYEVLKTRDPMLTLGGQYSEDLVKYYVLMNEKVIVLGANEDLSEEGQPLKVGDYAKVVGGGNFEHGDIVKIISDDGSGFTPLLCGLVRLGGDSDNECDGYLRRFKDYDDLVRATDEEVADAKEKAAEAKRLQAEAERWAKIGRKPNEFKKGDIVRVESNDRYNGVCGELEDYLPEQNQHSFGIRTFDGDYRAPKNETVKLVTPVDERFDRP